MSRDKVNSENACIRANHITYEEVLQFSLGLKCGIDRLNSGFLNLFAFQVLFAYTRPLG